MGLDCYIQIVHKEALNGTVVDFEIDTKKYALDRWLNFGDNWDLQDYLHKVYLSFGGSNEGFCSSYLYLTEDVVKEIVNNDLLQDSCPLVIDIIEDYYKDNPDYALIYYASY